MSETSKTNDDYVGMFFKETHVPDNVVLCVPFMLIEGSPSTIIEKLGMIKPRNDGRWSWFRFKQKNWLKDYNGGKTDQGVAPTKTQAMDVLLKAVPDHVDVSNVPFVLKTQKMHKGVITNG